MNTRDQFGNYLLLKKLTEDALGETFRAGRIGRQTLDRVVLLRVYNGQGLDTERVAKTIQSRGALAGALKSPNIANAVDSGQVRGVPYVAYDYVSGRTLAQIAEQATRRGQPVPLDHALLVAERIAAGLSVGYETRFGDDRVTHSVLTPGEVWVSHEGELRITGFEAAPGVRSAAGHPVIKQALGRFLAPEALAGQPPAKNDDVYGVASILFELLTGQATPTLPAGGFGPVIEQAVVAADGGNLHPDLAALLQRSLCPSDQRVGDIVAWHKTLAKLMADGQYNPTTFNLAFFLHSLFRDEIERETQELETERTQAIQIPAPVQPPAPTPATPAAAPTLAAPVSAVDETTPEGVRENTAVLREMYGIGGKSGGGKGGLIAAVAGGAVVVLAVVGYFLFFRGGPEGESAPAPETPAVEAAAPVPAEPAPPVETGPSPDEIQSQIARMVEEQSKQLEAGLKQKYDEQLRELQKQLEDARKTEERRAAPAPEPAARPTASAPEPPAARPQEPAARPPATATAPGTQPAPSPRPAEPEPEPAETATRPAAPAPAPTPAAPEPKPEPTVKLGDLVSPGAGVVPPRIVRRPALRYPPVAQRMRKEATVSLSVLVDHNGRVVEVKRLGGEAGFGLDEAAEDYAREISWAPATKNGIKVKMWYELRVAFSLSGR